MSKKKRIKKLEARIVELEAKLEQATPKKASRADKAPVVKQRAHKKPAKTAVNVYFDSNFVKSLAEASEDRLSRRERREIAYENRQRRKDVSRYRSGAKGPSKLWKVIKVFFRILFVLLVIALIAAVLGLIVMAVVWALVNFGITPLTNPFINFVWRVINRLFALFGMTVPVI